MRLCNVASSCPLEPMAYVSSLVAAGRLPAPSGGSYLAVSRVVRGEDAVIGLMGCRNSSFVSDSLNLMHAPFQQAWTTPTAIPQSPSWSRTPTPIAAAPALLGIVRAGLAHASANTLDVMCLIGTSRPELKMLLDAGRRQLLHSHVTRHVKNVSLLPSKLFISYVASHVL